MHHLLHAAAWAILVWSLLCAGVGGLFFGSIGYKVGKRRRD